MSRLTIHVDVDERTGSWSVLALAAGSEVARAHAQSGFTAAELAVGKALEQLDEALDTNARGHQGACTTWWSDAWARYLDPAFPQLQHTQPIPTTEETPTDV